MSKNSSPKAIKRLDTVEEETSLIKDLEAKCSGVEPGYIARLSSQVSATQRRRYTKYFDGMLDKGDSGQESKRSMGSLQLLFALFLDNFQSTEKSFLVSDTQCVQLVAEISKTPIEDPRFSSVLFVYEMCKKDIIARMLELRDVTYNEGNTIPVIDRYGNPIPHILDRDFVMHLGREYRSAAYQDWIYNYVLAGEKVEFGGFRSLEASSPSYQRLLEVVKLVDLDEVEESLFLDEESNSLTVQEEGFSDDETLSSLSSVDLPVLSARQEGMSDVAVAKKMHKPIEAMIQDWPTNSKVRFAKILHQFAFQEVMERLPDVRHC